VQPGKTTEIDVDLTSWVFGELSGVLTFNGAPVANAEISVHASRPMPGYPLAGTWFRPRTDAEGRFCIRARQGTLRIAVNREDPTSLVRQDQWVWSSQTVFLPAGGKVVHDFAVEACTLRLRVLDSGGAPIEGVSLFLDGGQWQWQRTTAPSGRDGRIVCEVEARTFTIQVLPRRLQSQEAWSAIIRAAGNNLEALAAHRLPLGNVTARPGEDTTLDVRLPAEWDR
jgi:hypothetical protein